jgi:RNA polymerase sigma factor (sigma-70 family)
MNIEHKNMLYHKIMSTEEEKEIWTKLENSKKRLITYIYINQQYIEKLINFKKKLKISIYACYEIDDNLDKFSKIDEIKKSAQNILEIIRQIEKCQKCKYSNNRCIGYKTKIISQIRIRSLYIEDIITNDIHISTKVKTCIEKTVKDIKYYESYITEKNAKLALSIVKKYNRPEIEDDLFQEGLMGIMKAVKKFKYELNYKFSTYATPWIKQYINRFLQNNETTIRLPLHIIELKKAINKIMDINKQENKKIPSIKEIAMILNETEDHIKLALETNTNTISAQTKIGQEEDSAEILENIQCEKTMPLEEAIYNELKEIISKQLESLKDKEKNIIILRFGLNGNNPHTLQEISNIMNLTRERIRQIEQNALNKLKKNPILKKTNQE